MTTRAMRTRTLLLDDDDSGRFVFSCLLEDAGYEVIQANSLAGARELISAQPLDLAILDVQLPDGLGTQLVPEVALAHPGAAIVVMSGNNAESIEGVHAYLTKAGEPTKILAQLEQARALAARRCS